MSDRTETFNQTTAEITLDLPATVSINTALDALLNRIKSSRARAKNPETLRALENQEANVEAAIAAFDPVYRKVLAAPLFTAEHEALIKRALEGRNS